MKHVFGPVPSRRLGQSLGIDPVPSKTCNWNCVYCQLGRTRPVSNQREHFFPVEEILIEVKETLHAHRGGGIDWITFVGSGETCLHAGLGEMIRAVKSNATLPVAVITNGSLLYREEVRRELSAADAVLPSLDAGNQELYRKINRPHPEITFQRLIEGLSAFREEYRGKLWVEVMLIRGLNDSRAALEELAVSLRQIRADEIHILLPTRPPCEPWVQPPDEDGITLAQSILGGLAYVLPPAAGSFDLSGFTSPMEAVIGIITRHPMREGEIIEALKLWPRVDVAAALQTLQESGRVQVIERSGQRFWSLVGFVYPPEAGE